MVGKITMRRSEIFDNFIKIAQEKGIISPNAPEQAKKKLENNPRADSLDISAIESLYGTKPNTPKDMEYKRNIIDIAHPESAIASPSYDKLNGLVENGNERQDIILNILNKMPTGQLTNKKYAEQVSAIYKSAEKDFILSLVSLGNDLDNQNKTELRVLADHCLDQTYANVKTKQLVKTAIAPMVVVAILAAAAGSIYAYNHLDNKARNYPADYKRLTDELADLSEGDITVGFGRELTPEGKTYVRNIKTRIDEFDKIYQQCEPYIKALGIPAPNEWLLPATIQKIKNATAAKNILKKHFIGIESYLHQVMDQFKNDAFKQSIVGETGVATQLFEDAHFLGGKTSAWADDFQDVVNMAPAYLQTIKNAISAIDYAENMSRKYKGELSTASKTYTGSTDQFAAEWGAQLAKNPFGTATTSVKQPKQPLTFNTPGLTESDERPSADPHLDAALEG